MCTRASQASTCSWTSSKWLLLEAALGRQRGVLEPMHRTDEEKRTIRELLQVGGGGER